MSKFSELDWADRCGLILLMAVGLGMAVCIAQAPGCIKVAEQEQTKRYRTTIIVQPCGEVVNEPQP